MKTTLAVLSLFLTTTLLLAQGEQQQPATPPPSPAIQAITAALIAATEDADREVRLMAYQALAAQPATDAVRQAVRRGLDDEHEAVRLVALNMLVESEGATPEVIKRLMEGLEDQRIAAQARRLLIELKTAAAKPLIESLSSDNIELQLTALDMLPFIPLGPHEDACIKQVTTLLKHESTQLRVAAIKTLQAIARTISSRENRSSQAANMARMMLQRYDGNGDDVLTEQEAPRLMDADSNKDGQVTLQEITERLGRNMRGNQ